MLKRISLFTLIACCVAAAQVVASAQRDASFDRFFTAFQAAVKNDDKEKIASMIRFDAFDWEATDALREVKSREAFLKNYTAMFTRVIRTRIATGKPVASDNGDRFIIWHTQGLEYSLAFDRQKDGSFTFAGLNVGPY